MTPSDCPRFASFEQAIAAPQPVEPVYCLHPEKFKTAVQRFLEEFPGDAMHAVKANPAPQVLDLVWASGIRHFDTASLGEVTMIKTRFPAANCHFMSPLRLPSHPIAATALVPRAACAKVCALARWRYRLAQKRRDNQ